MPALAASVMMATCLSPRWKAPCSSRFAPSGRSSNAVVPATLMGLLERPVISATFRGPPIRSMMSSSGFGGSSRRDTACSRPARARFCSGSVMQGFRTFSSTRMAISLGADAKPPEMASAPSRSASARVTASPVDHMVKTTLSPRSRADWASAMASSTFAQIRSCLKNCCWHDQNCLIWKALVLSERSFTFLFRFSKFLAFRATLMSLYARCQKSQAAV
mmetsp:Transcript_60825/g.178432  ORF Transcript_60825/g.178432 Transcript_60825/m.178432 type:complete len:219 (-) Transcript_60825:233-889(-)